LKLIIIYKKIKIITIMSQEKHQFFGLDIMTKMESVGFYPTFLTFGIAQVNLALHSLNRNAFYRDARIMRIGINRKVQRKSLLFPSLRKRYYDKMLTFSFFIVFIALCLKAEGSNCCYDINITTLSECNIHQDEAPYSDDSAAVDSVDTVAVDPSATSDNDGTSATGEAIDLGLSVKWASCNVGASSPEEYGGYYAWGETEEKSDYEESTYKYYNSSTDSYIDIGSSISGTQYDVAHVKWGGNWRMPTDEEFKELCDKCTKSWTKYNGVKGWRFVGPSGKSIFLPAAGCRWGTDVGGQGYNGRYWSGTICSDVSIYAWYLDFSDGLVDPSNNYRDYGFSVRPVSE
jgi:uncharacterized protein (TIGR02145 family)